MSVFPISYLKKNPRYSSNGLSVDFADILCPLINPTLFRGQLYSNSRWRVSQSMHAITLLATRLETVRSAEQPTCLPAGGRQNRPRDACGWETSHHERKRGERIWTWKLQNILLQKGKNASRTLYVIWSHRVGKERNVWVCWHSGGGAFTEPEDVYQSADSDQLFREKQTGTLECSQWEFDHA